MPEPGRWLRGGVLAAMVLAELPFAWNRTRALAPVPGPTSAPRRVSSGEYVSSDACRSCHPGEHASWQRTYHRTMTQLVTATSARGPDAELSLDGEAYAVHRRGDEVWATLPARGGVPASPRRLELSTGSHHYQGYWFAGQDPGTLQMLPFVYVFREGRWLPRRDVFLQPPDAVPHDVRWGSGCIQCHATAGQPGRDPSGSFDTRVAELGIACEACHGPGGDHARHYRDPVARYEAYARPDGARTSDAEAGIVNPARLSAERGSMVCGQCHGLTYPKDEDEWWRRGYVRSFRPGQDLRATRFFIQGPPAGPEASPVELDADVGSMFWPDGTVRVGGREYDGLVVSACFRKGAGARQLSCMSCHSMHDSDPAGQIARDRTGNDACLTCHEDKRAAVTAHTHHGADSKGSLCVSCHMPRTTYALLKGIVSHRIDSPKVSARAYAVTRPVACNLCHLDRTLAWTASVLHDWYGQPMALHDAAAGEDTAAGAQWLLSGDAALRVIAAAAFGSVEAADACGTGWQPPLLARATSDPYAAVRIVATRSLQAVRDRGVHPAPDAGGRPTLDDRAIDALVARRDDRAISISE